MDTAQAVGSITLQGSAQIVAEFFDYSINNILYQRGLYNETYFSRETHYGLPLMITKDKELKDYLKKVTSSLEGWLAAGTLSHVVLVIEDVETKDVIERWQFNINCDQIQKTTSETAPPLKKIQESIRNVIRQIVSSVTFLPVIESKCDFDLLFYTAKDAERPASMRLTDERLIEGGQDVALRDFDTGYHRVDGRVSYKCVE
ncbi:mitotic spindle assembly checkpoint protein MAD2A-like [Sycon ciliatum]|uniref:mitotic spindle assembly checkpoint protein MAD2A-like n=1 Tax=Sycon ciliatum TaxID=27933 RepID=UPI0020ABEA1F|eukprot:scpid77699/ scgid24156/ Mitotic spindle assembly checkpoint protein MAD2A; Mitotic arrest deficient 2-like protein 1